MLDEDGGFTARGGVGGLLIKVGGMEKRVEKQKFKKGGGHIGSRDMFSKITHIAKTKSAKFL